PAGKTWFDAATGKAYSGGQSVTAAAPRERMPLFIRAGSIVPTGPHVQWTGEDPQGAITLHIFAGADGAFTLYEDDGVSMGYERGEFALIPFAWDDAKRLLTIGDRDGTFPGMAAERRIMIVLHEGGSEAGPVFEQAALREVGYS